MTCLLRHAPGGQRCALVIAIAAAITAAFGAPRAVAQTLVSPNESQKLRPSQSAADPKAAAVKRAKSCAMYGEGFVYIPATDSCVKVGGYLQSDYMIQRGR